MDKSKESKTEPKSPSPAISSSQIAESVEPQRPSGNNKAKSPAQPEEDFESYYMKRITAEFADDIDRLRNAPDFNEQSVPILIEALRQGANGFREEREKVLGGKGADLG